jgi:surface antigen
VRTAVPKAVSLKVVPVRVVHHVAKRVVRTTTHVTHPVLAPAAPKPRPVVHQAAPKPAAVQAPAESNSYPWATATGNDLDTWGFTQRQCVSYAAWRLAKAGHAVSNTDGWGDASHWDTVARAQGFTVSSTPHVGDVAQWNAEESSSYYAAGASRPSGTFQAGGYGHVAYVTAVYADGSVQVAQYNATGNRSYSSMHMTAPRYLHA